MSFVFVMRRLDLYELIFSWSLLKTLMAFLGNQLTNKGLSFWSIWQLLFVHLFLWLRGSKTPKGNHEKPVEEESSRLACLGYQVAEDMRAFTHSWYRLNGENVNSYLLTSFIAKGFHREEQLLFQLIIR